MSYVINPYYAEVMKKRGGAVDDLKIVEHFFIPTDEDLEKLSKHIQDCKTVVDIGSGYGLLINELAKRNPEIKFLGIDTMYSDKKFQLPIVEKNVKFEFNGIEAMTSKRFNKGRKRKNFDGVICCWMPDGSDWREMLVFLAKKTIILILSKDFSTGTPLVYTGIEHFDMEGSWVSGNSIIQIWHGQDIM